MGECSKKNINRPAVINDLGLTSLFSSNATVKLATQDTFTVTYTTICEPEWKE